jgi:HlyD family secretion protein
MKRGTKIVLGAFALVAVVGTVGAIAAARRDKVVQVRIETVESRDLESVVNASGWVRPNRKVDVQADIMGRITALYVKEGDQVKRDQVLLRIDPAEYESAVERARAAVSEAQAREAQTRANLLQAKRAHERLLALLAIDSTLVSQQSLEEAETQASVQGELLEAATFSVAQSRAAMGEAQDRLRKTVIRAPMDGIVTRLNVDEGETAIVGTMNNAGSLLLTVADLSIMEAVVRVDETDVPNLSVGDSAALTFDALPKQTFWGRVTEISHSSVRPPESQAASGQGQGQAIDFEVVIAIESPPTALRSDLSATADIVTDKRAGALSIPIIALTVREESDIQEVPQEDPAARAAAAAAAGGKRPADIEGVFVVRNGEARFAPVQVGIAGREHFEVLNGIAEGDSVIAGPYEAIRSLTNGQKVRSMTSGQSRGPAAANQTAGKNP